MRGTETIVASSDNTMSKKPARAPQDDESTAKPISYRPSKKVAKALEEYRGTFVFPPDKSAVIEKALTDYLISVGAMKKD